MTLQDLTEGSPVLRHLSDSPDFMTMTVTDVTHQGTRLCCGPWEFDRETGWEIDDELGWGPAYGHTGSYIRPKHS